MLLWFFSGKTLLKPWEQFKCDLCTNNPIRATLDGRLVKKREPFYLHFLQKVISLTGKIFKLEVLVVFYSCRSSFAFQRSKAPPKSSVT